LEEVPVDRHLLDPHRLRQYLGEGLLGGGCRSAVGVGVRSGGLVGGQDLW
jgi:hypothetical protein